MTTPFRLDGKTALVTGGASGIGEATSRIFAQAGAKVLIVDLNQERAQALASELGTAAAHACDITNEEQVKALYSKIPHLDCLVNNAGIGLVGNIEETSLEDFQRLCKVNVDGLFLRTRYAMPHLLASRGSVVNIASVAGLVGVKRRFAYCATKGAVVAITKQLAVDYAGQIRANCACPGTVDTPFVEAYLENYHKHEKTEMREQLNKRQPVGRLGKPEEIGYLALYLASEQAEFVTGADYAIDGGWTAA